MQEHAAQFRRHWWLPSGHLETIAAAYNETPSVRYERLIVKTRGNDEIALDYVIGDPQKPLLVIFHGLEGCSQSRTIRLLASGFVEKKWTVAVPHFRSCGNLMNRLPRAYHAADADEIEWMLTYCQSYFEHSQWFAAGVSLGGSALLQCLARRDIGRHLNAAATICTPFDLTACVRALDRGLNRRLYGRHFLNSLRAKVLEKAKRYPSICDIKKLRSARTMAAFDELYTAPVHGFTDAKSYWLAASSHSLLGDIPRPLLCINCENDPLIPAITLPPPATARPPLFFCRPKHGGHGGFFGAPPDWLFATTHQFFTAHGDAT